MMTTSNRHSLMLLNSPRDKSRRVRCSSQLWDRLRNCTPQIPLLDRFKIRISQSILNLTCSKPNKDNHLPTTFKILRSRQISFLVKFVQNVFKLRNTKSKAQLPCLRLFSKMKLSAWCRSQMSLVSTIFIFKNFIKLDFEDLVS